MPAHLRNTGRRCEWEENRVQCSHPVAVALYSTANVVLGYFCNRHGREALARAKAAEEEAS